MRDLGKYILQKHILKKSVSYGVLFHFQQMVNTEQKNQTRDEKEKRKDQTTNGESG